MTEEEIKTKKAITKRLWFEDLLIQRINQCESDMLVIHQNSLTTKNKKTATAFYNLTKILEETVDVLTKELTVGEMHL